MNQEICYNRKVILRLISTSIIVTALVLFVAESAYALSASVAYVNPCQAGMVVGEACKQVVEPEPVLQPREPVQTPNPPGGGRRLPRAPHTTPQVPTQPQTPTVHMAAPVAPTSPPVQYSPPVYQQPVSYRVERLSPSGIPTLAIGMLFAISLCATIAFSNFSLKSNNAKI